MGRFILSALLLLLLAPPSAHGAKLECTDPDTGDKTTVRPNKLTGKISKLKKQLKRRKIHILDLSDEAIDHRFRIESSLAEQDWCLVAAHIRIIEDAVFSVSINEGFISRKFGRVERWFRAGRGDDTMRMTVERHVANAAAQISDGDYAKANDKLNTSITMLFGLSTLWDVPPEKPTEGEVEEGDRIGIDSDEVEEGCPVLAKKGKGKRSDLDDSIRRLRKLMNKRKIRPMDIKGGNRMVADLRSYVKLSAIWPGIRVTCALLARTKNAEIDLGMVQGRFHEISKLRERNGVPKGMEERFSELVRGASDHMAAREFEDAHSDLEDLFVLLGKPSKPAHRLPKL